jgi:uncharacterized SAM-binding protein YcdF (DUF218 family)
MFFFASKLLEFFLTPSNLIGLMALAGVGLSFVRIRWGRAVVLATVAFLVLAGWTPLGPALLGALENRFPIPEVSGPVAGIILLGGAVDTHVTGERGQVALNEGGERFTTVVELSRRFPEARVFLSGGASHIVPTGPISESAAGRRLLIDLGVAGHRIELEERSRNTCENAAETKASLQVRQGEQWILVTSANHMPRAMACFLAHGFPVIAYPVDFRTMGTEHLRFLPAVSEGLGAFDLAVHEWLGLFTYRLFGLTDELFPRIPS